MEFKQLEAFAAVAELKNFSLAAKQLYLSQPTVSLNIKALEKELGCSLIDRSTRSVELTESGRQLYLYAHRILELRQSALEHLSKPAYTEITIAASTIPSAYLLPGLLAEFRKGHPDIYFSILQSDSMAVENMVIDGTVDLGILGAVSRPNEHCTAEELVRDTLVLAVPASGHFLKLGDAPDLKELLRHEPVILREEGSGTRKAMNRVLEYYGIDENEIHSAARSNDPESIKRMIADGLGISVLSAFCIQDMVLAGRLLTWPVGMDRTRSFYLLRRKDRRIVSGISEFETYLKQELKKLNPGGL